MTNARRMAKKRKRKLAKEKKRKLLFKYARRLNRWPPEAEVWFKRRWIELGMCSSVDAVGLFDDRFNYPVGPYIPDVLNVAYRYAIEVDEKHHECPAQKEYDAFRQRRIECVYKLKVFRVKAYDEEGLLKLVDSVKRRKTRPMNADGTWAMGRAPIHKSSPKACESRSQVVEEILNGPASVSPSLNKPKTILRKAGSPPKMEVNYDYGSSD